MPGEWPAAEPPAEAGRTPVPVRESPQEPVREAAAEPAPDAAPEPPGPADPAPLGVPRTATGVPEVDSRLDRLADADHLEVSGHLEVYEDVHRGLRDTLTALDRRPGTPAPAPSPGPSGPVNDLRS